MFNTLQFHLDNQGKATLSNLSRWAKVLGTINIVLGSFNGFLSIPLLFGNNGLGIIALPSLIMSGILLYMGLHLTGASSKLQFAILNESDQAFSDALDRIQKFFFLSATLYLLGIFMILMMVGLGFMPGTGVQELVPENSGTISI